MRLPFRKSKVPVKMFADTFKGSGSSNDKNLFNKTVYRVYDLGDRAYYFPNTHRLPKDCFKKDFDLYAEATLYADKNFTNYVITQFTVKVKERDMVVARQM